MWRNNKFLHNCQDFTILHICHVKKSEIPLHFSDFSPFAMYRNLKFLHMTDFSPHVSHVNYVTNMRYGPVPQELHPQDPALASEENTGHQYQPLLLILSLRGIELYFLTQVSSEIRRDRQTPKVLASCKRLKGRDTAKWGQRRMQKNPRKNNDVSW